MNGLKYIKSKQQNWANRKNYKLVGGTIPDKGEKNYVESLYNNLFQELTPDNSSQFKKGDGGETKDNKFRLAKMKAIHSSSAIVVNVFQYWQKKKDITPLAYVNGLCSKFNSSQKKIFFEQHFEISSDKSKFPKTPNIDIVIRNQNGKIYAIESKFTEPYGRKHKGIKQEYINSLSFWNGLDNLKKLAEEICPDDNKFQHLDAAQLIKHILGLKNKYKKSDFHLLYLWYDVIGQEGAKHRKEIEQFAEIARKDNIKFSQRTYQEVIIKLTQEFYIGNEEYCNYLSDRYL
ncbi:PGN_0703 family putative restriction endonuclease [Flavobacterium solisilvae]|uniref:Restriction endonuclease n=1 Tax=Flavobacterium solisilvae TaxID=1852019 RepID=A0ABX1QPI3_9FLAO|nr:hypothetical protein [Flavobacterium solisilvae]NMH23962.1 hypothetical protein [Flavobacterium solisilvae]